MNHWQDERDLRPPGGEYDYNDYMEEQRNSRNNRDDDRDQDNSYDNGNNDADNWGGQYNKEDKYRNEDRNRDSHGHRDRDRDRDRDTYSRERRRDRDRSRSRSRSRSTSRSRSRRDDRSRDKDKRQRSRDRDRRDGSDDRRRRSSPGRHDRRGRDRDRDRSRDRDRHSSSEDERKGRSRRQASPTGEWYCRCGSLNFKRRLVCYRSHCRAPRSEAVSPPPPGVSLPRNSGAAGVAGGLSLARPMSVEDVATMAEYSANLYATNPQEKIAYLRYYSDYFMKQLPASSQNGIPQPSDAQTETDRVNAAAAVAQSAISQVQAKTAPAMMSAGTSQLVLNRKYPIPNTSLYIYDETSGYYYDPTTGLYYDANTQYYYNPQTGGYLYWDPTKMTYSPSPTVTAPVAPEVVKTETPPTTPAENEKPKKGDEKQEKVKIAKKIAKDMERWAKTLNQKKDASKYNSFNDINEQNSKVSVGSADIGFSVLEMRNPNAGVTPTASRPPLIPSYSGGDSSGDEDEEIVDLKKLACLLCKRQFASREILEKHLTVSDLHRQNLEVHRSKKLEHNAHWEHKYRDRAAERRSKYGGDEPPLPPPENITIFAPIPQEIGEDNVGNRLLQKMGWRAGKGLGREEQGIVGPVEAQSSTPGLGLGVKRGIYTAGPGETYSACIKKLTAARYQDLIGSESKT